MKKTYQFICDSCGYVDWIEYLIDRIGNEYIAKSLCQSVGLLGGLHSN